MRLLRFIVLSLIALPAALAGQGAAKLSIPFEKYTLGNGLDVVLHEDRSDPIVAVAILYHVGSGREVVGRTGFAHLFEHMMFQSSQHVGEDQFFKKIQSAGGTLNGGTSFDQTVYYEVIPKNALEMALWLESDRMGYLLPTVTQEAFVNQQDVVQNEKRQRVDNVPYGHTSYVIGKLLYPEAHPYSWQVIGSFADLRNATIEDIRDFFRKWYGPNNATLVVAGDFDQQQTRAWIAKYFGELESSPPVADAEPMPVSLAATTKVFHEDNFARSPELNMVFPTVEEYHRDAYALELLAQLLSDGKKAPFYKVLVEERKLAPNVGVFQGSLELAGTFRVRVRAFPGKSLTDVERAVHEAFARFEQDGFTDRDLDRIKAQTETRFYNRISSVLSKAFQLASYNEFAGSPGYVTEDIDNSLNVTKEDIWRVYEAYIKGRPYVLTSFVPTGQVDLVAEGSERFPIQEESIAAAGVGESGAATAAPVPPIPSSFDRLVEPVKGPSPDVTLPTIWSHTYANGLRIYGIQHTELPLVNFALTLRGGMLLDDMNKVGVANLMTDVMMEGTANKTPLELEEAIEELGANIGMFTTDESIVIRANALSSRLEPTYQLFEEILLEPRWDEKEFGRIKDETIETIRRRMVDPGAIASGVFDRLVYGRQHILGNQTLGTDASVNAITIDDLKGYYAANFSPSVSHVAVVGNISKEDAIALFAPLEKKWPAKQVHFTEYAAPQPAERSAVYFVDVPKAKQSQIYVGHLGVSRLDPNYYPLQVMNYSLGGSFNGVLNMILREEKGYTYGARSGFRGSENPGEFLASSSVRSNATLESAMIFRDEIAKYREGISEEDLAFTKSALIQSDARRFETLGALQSMLSEIGTYELPFDYVKREEEVVRNMTLEEHRRLAQQYIHPDRMIYLVVGDAETQMEPLSALGLGTPILLDVQGNRVAAAGSQ